MPSSYCPACYGPRRYCRSCKIQHCQCTWSLKQCAKLFREFLNDTCVEFIDQGRNSRGQRFVRRTRGYGDYLYSQDRDAFDFEFSDTKDGKEFGKWLASREVSEGK